MAKKIEKVEEKKEEIIKEESFDKTEDIEEQDEKKKEKKGKEVEAVVNIYTSFNNTLVHVTDMAGKTIAMFIAKRISEIIKDLGIKYLYVRIRAKTRNPAPGPGANPIIKSLSREGYKILNILDTTRFPRGGPKKKGGRRGRRP